MISVIIWINNNNIETKNSIYDYITKRVEYKMTNYK